MKNRTLLIVVIALGLFGVATVIVASILHDGLSARATPNRLEIKVARSVRHFAIPASAQATPNPVLASAEDLRDARLHYADHCAICHGNDGSGKTMMGEGLFPKPPDLRLAATQNLTDGELFWIIENGIRFTGMPGFSNGGDHGGVQDSWKLVHFVRHLPHLSAAERIEMERYNPKGPEDREEEQKENEFLNGATDSPKAKSKDRRKE